MRDAKKFNAKEPDWEDKIINPAPARPTKIPISLFFVTSVLKKEKPIIKVKRGVSAFNIPAVALLISV